MRSLLVSVGACIFLLSVFSILGRAAVTGDYLEARSADIYTGPCFAMSEVNLTGREAILAWKVNQGEWKGVTWRA